MNSEIRRDIELVAVMVSRSLHKRMQERGVDFLFEKDIDEIVEEVKEKLKLIEDISDEAFEIQKKQLKTSCDLKQESGRAIVDQGLQSWYPERKPQLNHFYWNRFKEYLETECADRFVNPINPKESPLTKLDETSDKIIDLLGNPGLDGFNQKGLILGDVQSGKTINFTALMNKAADVGYKLFIVLTGTIEALRKQTQERLENDFVGAQSTDSSKILGVGKRSENEGRTPLILTTLDNDVGKSILDLRNVNLERNIPVVVVCKKNVTVLTALKKWLKRSQNEINALRVPTLILDDEADYASVNTAKDDEEPTRINGLIREILCFFKKKTYVAVTATP